MPEIETALISPKEAYHLVTRLIGPRPIALVSSASTTGRVNLAPFSYFMMGGSNPPSCVICPLNDRHGNAKDTLHNIVETGEYVINACTHDIAEKMNACSYPYERGVNEFDKSGLRPTASVLVAPPRVADSPVQLECRLFQHTTHGDGPLASNYLIGEIVQIHVDEAVLGADGLPDAAKLRLIGRFGGDDYTLVDDASLFRMQRPVTPA